MENRTRFILKKDPERYSLFESMVLKISENINVKPKLIKECGEEAFRTWEEDESLNFSTFYSMKSEFRESEVNLVLENFRKNMESLSLSEEKLNKSMEIASDVMSFMFLTPKGSYWL
ncbi:MAG: hypothetical protein GY870_01580 [archaeon]|nr:hypothetical protein [archaeon]